MKRGRKLVVVYAAAVLALMLTLPVCAGGQQGKQGTGGTIRVATQFPDLTEGIGLTADKIFQKFRAEHPEIDLQVEGAPGDALRDKIKIDLAAGNLPDVIYYWGLSSLNPMVEAGLLLDVSKYIEDSDAVDWDDWGPDAWAEVSTDGERYWAIPVQYFTDYVLANTELFDKYGFEIPETYDELISVSQVFADNGIIPMSVGSKGGNPSHFFFAEVWYQLGSQEYMRDVTAGNASYNCPETIRTAEIILDMAKNRVFPADPIGSGDFGPPVALYNEGKAAMIVAQTWMIRQFKQDIVDKSKITDMPTMPGSVTDPKTFTVGGYNNTWAIKAKQYDNPATHDGFVDLLDGLTSDEFFAAVTQWALPAKKIDLGALDVPPLYMSVYNYYVDQGTRNMHWGHMPDPISQEVFSTAMDELWTQNITPKAFAEKIQASIDDARR